MQSLNAPILKNRIFLSVLFIAIGIFIIFTIPNSRASENFQMVQVFEPDEAIPLPYLFKMIQPSTSIYQSLKQFFFYEYYFYGFPHFGYSALLILPLSWLGLLENAPLVMLILRQGTSVLLMLLAIIMLVYMQDEFRSYRSIVIFGLLVLIPAVVQNNFWWHPDGMVTLFSVLTQVATKGS